MCATAEVVPKAGDLATKGDIARLEAANQAEHAALEARLMSSIDSRLLRYTAMILVPASLTMLGAVGALIAVVAKL